MVIVVRLKKKLYTTIALNGNLCTLYSPFFQVNKIKYIQFFSLFFLLFNLYKKNQIGQI